MRVHVLENKYMLDSTQVIPRVYNFSEFNINPGIVSKGMINPYFAQLANSKYIERSDLVVHPNSDLNSMRSGLKP